MANNKVYFFSDFHLGRPAKHSSLEREQLILNLFQEIKKDAKQIYLVGDMFDYWFEYKQVVPREFVRFIAALDDLKASGIAVEIFTGNHDMWMFDFFQKDLDIPVHRDPITRTHFGKQIFIAHGDGLGPGDNWYKLIKKIFRNKFCQWLFARLHPNFAIGTMRYFSNLSKKRNEDKHPFESFEKEWLVQFCNDYSPEHHIDFFVCGHRHVPMIYQLQSRDAQYINLGDSLTNYTYGVLDESGFSLACYIDEKSKIYTNC